ncbi:hypothetical protein GGI08_007827, partial [Coemansia sp. S2]
GTSMASDSPAPAKFSKGTQVGEPPATTISCYVETDKPGSIDKGVQVNEPQAVMTTSTATQTAATVSVAIETHTAPAMSVSTTTETVAVRSVATQPAKKKRKVKGVTASTQTAMTVAKIREWVKSKHIEFAASNNFTTSDNIRRTYHDSLANAKLVDMYSRTTTWSLRRGGNKSDKANTSGPSAPVARTVSGFSDKQTRHTANTSAMPATNTNAHLSSSQLPTTASTLTLACGTTTAMASAAPATSTNATPSGSQILRL